MAIMLSILAVAAGKYVGRMIVPGGGGGGRIEQVAKPYYDELQQHPKFKERFKDLNYEKTYQESMKLSSAGLKRLPVEDLMLRAKLLEYLLDHSDPKNCAAIAMGNADSKKAILTAVEALPDDMLKDWISLGVRAIKAELDGGVYVEASSDDVTAGYQELAEWLSPAEKSVMMKLTSNSQALKQSATHEEICSMAKGVFRSIPKMSAHGGEVVARSMVESEN